MTQTLAQIDAAIATLKSQRQALVASQQQARFNCVKNGNRKVLVVGGAGQLGRLFVDLLERSDYQVSVVEQDDWQNASQDFQSAALVLLAVPIRATVAVIEQLPALAADCVLADVTSIKQRPLEAMMAKHAGPVIGLHPMFGPDVPSFEQQTIITCTGQLPDGYAWWLEQLKVWGAVLRPTDAVEHDRAMAIIQVMRHLTTIAYGQHLMQEQTDLHEVTQLSSPIYRLELAMVGRLFAQDPTLYTDIIFSNRDNVQMLRRYLQRFDTLLNQVESQDKDGFIDSFNAISDWFGDYAQQFLKESAAMLNYDRSALQPDDKSES